MNHPHLNRLGFAPFNPIEFDGIKSGFLSGQNTCLGYNSTNIPAKPLVQTKLKRGGFFV